MKNYEDPAPVDVSTLEEEVENYNRQIKTLQKKFDVATRQHGDEKDQVDASEKQLKEIDKKIKAALELADPVKVVNQNKS